MVSTPTLGVGAPPPEENPGSATGSGSTISQFGAVGPTPKKVGVKSYYLAIFFLKTA